MFEVLNKTAIEVLNEAKKEFEFNKKQIQHDIKHHNNVLDGLKKKEQELCDTILDIDLTLEQFKTK